jgi:parallel beta-helix repeat protein
VVDSTNVTIINNNWSNGDPITLAYTNNSEIFNNSVSNSSNGLYLDWSHNNRVRSNNFTKNNDGVSLYDSANNSVTRNNISSNYYGLRFVSGSNNNTINNNVISLNLGFAIGFSGSPGDRPSNNTFSYNNLDSNDNGFVEEGGFEINGSNETVFNLIANNTISNSRNRVFSMKTSGFLVYNMSIDSIRTSFTGKNIHVNSSPESPAFPSSLSSINKNLEITNHSIPGPFQEESWIFLNISYNSTDLGSVDESTLGIYEYDNATATWNMVPGSSVNTAQDYVYANITDFSTFGVASALQTPGDTGGSWPPTIITPTAEEEEEAQPIEEEPEKTQLPEEHDGEKVEPTSPAPLPPAPPEDSPNPQSNSLIPISVISLVSSIAAVKMGSVPVGKAALGGTAAATAAGSFKIISAKAASTKVVSVGSNERILNKLFDFVPIPAFIGRLKYQFNNPVLENEVRLNIFTEIIQNPGIHIREIQRRGDVSSGTVSWHLRILEGSELIKSEKEGYYRLYYPAKGIVEGENELFIPNPTRRKVMEAVIKRPGISQTQISEEIGVHLSTAFHHIRQLLESDLIAEVKDGNTRKYFSLLKLEN